jgi:DNA polymerase-3 subunit epsilon
MRHNLDVLCGHYGIPLDHHHAGSDSRACAEILLHYLEEGADIRQSIRTCSFRDERRSPSSR